MHERLHLFTWRTFIWALPTRKIIHSWVESRELRCMFCDHVEVTDYYLFLAYPFTNEHCFFELLWVEVGWFGFL